MIGLWYLTLICARPGPGRSAALDPYICHIHRLNQLLGVSWILKNESSRDRRAWKRLAVLMQVGNLRQGALVLINTRMFAATSATNAITSTATAMWVERILSCRPTGPGARVSTGRTQRPHVVSTDRIHLSCPW